MLGLAICILLAIATFSAVITFAAFYFCYLSSVKLKLLAKSQKRKCRCRPTTLPDVCQESVTFDPEARRSQALHTEQSGEGNGRCTPKARRQQKAGNLRESEDYWASNDSSGDSYSGEKAQAKKPRVKRCSTTRCGVTDSSDSNSSDIDRSEKQLLPITQTQDEKMGRDRSFEGNLISYSGDEKRKASDSETAEPIEDRSPHVDRVSYKYTYQEPWKTPEVLQLKSEVTQLKQEQLKLEKENSELKKELATKDHRYSAVLNSLLKEKDTENKKLKEDIEALKKDKQMSRQRSEQIEELKRQLEVALKRSEFEADGPAEDLTFGDHDDPDMQDLRHRQLSQRH